MNIEELAERLRRGDEDAASLLYHRFARRLLGLAALHLQHQLRAKVDPEDVVQSAWKSFFRRQAAGALDLTSWDSLWSLLMRITLRKCAKRAHHFQAGRRDVRREAAAEGPEGDAPEAAARDATPFETAVLIELVEHLFRGLKDRECQMLQQSLEGYTAPEIGSRVGVSERSVYRLLDRIRRRLERLNDADAGD